MLYSGANGPAVCILGSKSWRARRLVYNNKRGVSVLLILPKALISRIELKVPASPCKIKTLILSINPKNISMASLMARAKTESSTSTGSASSAVLWLPTISMIVLRRYYRKGPRMEAKFNQVN